MIIRKTAAWIILTVLIVTPFINWRLGAVIWMCAWIIYILQLVFAKLHGHRPPPPDK